MRLVKPIFLALLAVALGAYAFDCSAMTTPEQAMQCCNSMPCSRQGHHGQDCCKTMPAMRAPFVQPSVGRGVSHAPAVATLPAFSESSVLGSCARIVTADPHAPPILYSTAPQPLRV
jgi:hypothetical protein